RQDFTELQKRRPQNRHRQRDRLACQRRASTGQLRGEIFRRQGQAREAAVLEGGADVRNNGQQALLQDDRGGQVGPRGEKRVPPPLSDFAQVASAHGGDGRVRHRLAVVVA